jgi:SOS response regulatory protein OraA/RecX
MEKSGYIANLTAYIEKNLAKGYTPDSLKFALINQGYSRTEIDRAFKIVTEKQAKRLPPVEEKPVITVETEPPLPEKKSFWQTVKGWFKSESASSEQASSQ